MQKDKFGEPKIPLLSLMEGAALCVFMVGVMSITSHMCLTPCFSSFHGSRISQPKAYPPQLHSSLAEKPHLASSQIHGVGRSILGYPATKPWAPLLRLGGPAWQFEWAYCGLPTDTQPSSHAPFPYQPSPEWYLSHVVYLHAGELCMSCVLSSSAA